MGSQGAALSFGNKNAEFYSSILTFKKAGIRDSWSLNATALRYAQSDAHNVAPQLTAAILLHTPLILLPTGTIALHLAEYTYLFSEVAKNTAICCETDEDAFILVCVSEKAMREESFGQLSFTFRGTEKEHEFNVPVANYISITDGGHKAVFKVMHVPDVDCIGLGTAFLKDLYVHLNAEYSEISLGWK